MPLILRKVSRAKWYAGAGQGLRPDDEVAAEDFEDADNEISVWEIDDSRSNLNRIIAAIAGTREFLTHVDYVLFDSTLATNCGISLVEDQAGDTHDHYANGNWHRNLSNPSRLQVMALVAAIKTTNPVDPAVRVKPMVVLRLLREAIENRWMAPAVLAPQLQRKLTAP